MAKVERTIPQVRRPAVLDPLPARSAALRDRDDGPATSLETERVGLLARPSTPVDGERRMEDWIASNLDLDLESEETLRNNVWNRFIERLPALKRAPKKRRDLRGPETAFADWERFRIAYRRGITVVRLVDRALVKESRIRELAGDLLDLIEAGNHRVVLNFQVVERLASWVIVAVDEASRQCKLADGGELKICGLQPPLADIFAIAGVAEGIDLHPDETTALESTWPEPSGPRPLPVEILLALTTAADIPPLRGGAPSETVEAGDSVADRREAVPHLPLRGPAPKAEPGVWLIVQIGGTKGRPVSVGGPRYLIGRDRDCQLRLGSAMVSKRHAAIERRDGRFFLQDLGSTNGTVLNGRVLRSKEVEVHHGDRIQIGLVVCTLVIKTQLEGCGTVEEQVAEWVLEVLGSGRGELDGGTVEEQVAEWVQSEVPSSHPDHAESQETVDLPTTAEAEAAAAAEAEAEPALHIKVEVIQDVLVVTPRVGELDSEITIELLRSHLDALFHQPLPRQVVVNFECVAHLSAQAIGMLLAHHLRLDRAGGALRICQARARIMAALHQVRLTMLVECHPTLDEAVLSAWPCMPKPSLEDE